MRTRNADLGDAEEDVAGDGAGGAGEEASVLGEEGYGDAAFGAEVQQEGGAHDVAERDEAGERVDGQPQQNGAVLFGDDGFALLPEVDALRLDVEGVEQLLHDKAPMGPILRLTLFVRVFAVHLFKPSPFVHQIDVSDY